MMFLFLILTYALMWALFFTVAFAVPADTVPGYLLTLLGAFAPGIVALALTVRAEGKQGVSALLGRVLQWEVPARWYLFAAGYLVTIKLTAAVIQRVASGEWPRFGTESLLLVLGAVVLSTPFQAGEEIGWRGYALPRLAARFGFARAGLLLGLIWGSWHLPQFFIPLADTYQQSFLVYVLQVIALSVAMTWLYSHTGGSLLPVMLMHSAVNNTKDVIPSAMPEAPGIWSLNASAMSWIGIALLWIGAAYFLVRMPAAGITSAGAARSRK